MIILSEEQEERAVKIHSNSFIFDYSPLGEPFIMTERQRKVMIKALNKGKTRKEILRSMAFDRLNELKEEENAREQIRNVWLDSGVNAVQVTLGMMEINVSDWDAILSDLGRWCRRVDVDQNMVICKTSAELEKAFQNGQVGLLLGLQDTLAFGKDLDRLETIYNMGVRVIQLTFNTRNFVGDGCMERHQSGVSLFGAELIKIMNKLGIVIDVSHSGYQTTLDAIELSEKPVAVTHSSCKSLADCARAKTDQEIRLLAESDGYMGIVAAPMFISTSQNEPDIEDMMRHVDYAVNIMGINRVGIASDWGLWSTDVPFELHGTVLEASRAVGFRPEDGIKANMALGEFVNWTDWYYITRGLVSRGYNDDDIYGLLGGNWLNYFKKITGI